MGNEIIIYNLVSFRDEDEYINGLHYGLVKNDVNLIVQYFRNSGKWSNYYYYEIGEHYLNNDDLVEILNLKCPFLTEKSVICQFSSWSVKHESRMALYYMADKEWVKFQSYYKHNNQPSHFFLLNDAEFDLVISGELKIGYDGSYCADTLLNRFISKHRSFDTYNYFYKLEYINLKNILFVSEGDMYEIKLDNE